MNNIAIFASGAGTNAINIIKYFNNHPNLRIDSVWSNNKEAFVLQRAQTLGVQSRYFTREEFSGSDKLLLELKHRNVKVIVLAGFLWLIPPEFIDTFSIINIHPALLPSYGGKGMYGLHVHESVIRNKEKISGITIHLVNKEYDKGEILLQIKCPVFPDDNPNSLAARIHELEYQYFPRTIEEYIIKTL